MTSRDYRTWLAGFLIIPGKCKFTTYVRPEIWKLMDVMLKQLFYKFYDYFCWWHSLMTQPCQNNLSNLCKTTFET